MNKFRLATIGSAVLAVATLVSGCGSTNEAKTPTGVVGSVTTSGISADRCQANRDAGQILYLTSFDYAASASILDVVAADAQGYFKKMCLDVKLQSGFTVDNIPLVSANKAQFSSLSSASEVANAVEHQSKLEAIALYGHTAIDELAVSNKSNVNEISDIKGTTMGVLGAIPYDIQVMLVNNGVPLDSFKQMQVSFDPTLLAKGDFQSRPVYKSSEPRQLDAAGVGYHVFDPSQEHIPASFGAMIVSNDFASAHPSAVEDFLRADLMGFQYALENPDDAVKDAVTRSNPTYYLTEDSEKSRWSIESTLVKQSTPNGKPYGYMSDDEWNAEIRPLVDAVKIIPSMNNVPNYYDSSYLDQIYNGTSLIWPAN